jgi:hypothetical protein
VNFSNDTQVQIEHLPSTRPIRHDPAAKSAKPREGGGILEICEDDKFHYERKKRDGYPGPDLHQVA